MIIELDRDLFSADNFILKFRKNLYFILVKNKILTFTSRKIFSSRLLAHTVFVIPIPGRKLQAGSGRKAPEIDRNPPEKIQ